MDFLAKKGETDAEPWKMKTITVDSASATNVCGYYAKKEEKKSAASSCPTTITVFNGCFLAVPTTINSAVTKLIVFYVLHNSFSKQRTRSVFWIKSCS